MFYVLCSLMFDGGRKSSVGGRRVLQCVVHTYELYYCRLKANVVVTHSITYLLPATE